MKKLVSAIVVLTMVIGLLVTTVSATEGVTKVDGSGGLKGKTALFTVEADDAVVYENGEKIVKFRIFVQSKDNIPIRALSFKLQPSANLTLADSRKTTDNPNFFFTISPNSDYSLCDYTPPTNYFALAGSDENKGITAKTEVMTIMGEVNGIGNYTLNLTDVIAGDGDAPDNITRMFDREIHSATVQVVDGRTNVKAETDSNTADNLESFTVSLSYSDMRVSSFTAGLDFDRNSLKVTKIEKCGGYTKLAAGAMTEDVSTLTEANNTGNIGVAFTRTDTSAFAADTILKVTFRSKTTGVTTVSAYEDSDGAMGYAGQSNDLVLQIKEPVGVTVSGTVKSYGDASAAVIVKLMQGGAVVMEQNGTGTSTAYSFEAVPAGTYTLKVEKKNHVTREYAMVVDSEDVQQDVTILLLGDVSGDGKLTLADYGKVLQHVKKVSLLTDYEFLCADINGDGRLTLVDYGKILQHVKKVTVLW